jgi:hypothetical protein
MKLDTALKLEKVVEKLLTSRLKSLNTPENFDRAEVDIYPGDYGIHCHITFLMKETFSGEDSDFFNGLTIGIYISKALGDVFTSGIQSSHSTIDHYEKYNKKWYNLQKQRFQ